VWGGGVGGGVAARAPARTPTSFPPLLPSALLWRRADNLCCVLLLDGEGGPAVGAGEAAEVAVKAILQIADATAGPATKREYETAMVPVGDGAAGRVVDFRGRALDGNADGVPGAATLAPLLAEPPPMDARESINSALSTGVKGIDVLTPVGRGQCLLVLGADGAGKSTAMLDAAAAAAASGVRVVYAAVGGVDGDAAAASLARAGALPRATVVAARAGAPLGERFAALAAATAIAERARDSGGHALLVLDDASSAVGIWEAVAAALARAGRPAADADPATLAAVASSPSLLVDEDGDALVEYEGMLVSATAAARRRFLGALLQRPAKLSARLGGGTLTALVALPGLPAVGFGVAPGGFDPESLTTLTEGQRAKLATALKARAPDAAAAPTTSVRTEAVEEFMSIADGQAVFVRAPGGGAPRVDAAASVSRVGARAYPPALRSIAPSIRLDLAQAADGARFGAGSAEAAARAARADRVRAALVQPPGWPVPVDELAVTLIALEAGFVDGVAPDAGPRRIALLVAHLRRADPALLARLADGAPDEADAAALWAAMETVAGQLAS